MTDSLPAHIFLDANTALHFRRPDEIDWCALTGSKRVVLVGAPIFHRELEQQKIHNASRKLRERAGAYIKWLAQFVRDPTLEVRPRTTWQFISVEPLIDFASHNLSTLISDDHLIASVITYSPSSDASVRVATADIGLEVKLRHRSIQPLLLPDSVRLPEEADPQEKELLHLRRQLAQRRSPILALDTEMGSDRHPISICPQVTLPSAPSLSEISAAHPALLVPGSPSPAATDHPMAGIFQAGAILRNAILPPERVALYNNGREEFLAEYQKFLDELLVWEEQKALTVEVRLSLSNTGTAPASDVDIILHFPDDLVLMITDDLPPAPDQPEPPQRPDRIPDLWGSSLGGNFTGLLHPTYPELPTPRFDSSAEVNPERHQATYWLKNLKHGFTQKLEPVFFWFPDRGSVRQFHAEYQISAAELPEAITGRLHFLAP